MRVAIVGAGAIGAYVGAALERAGADVHLIARGPHLTAMRQHGVQVLSPRGDFTARVHATDDPSAIGPVDYVFLGLKAHAYAACSPLVDPLLHNGTAVIAAQNGIPWWYFHGLKGPYEGRRIESVDPGGAVSRALPPERAIGCVIYAATELAAPGVVRHLEGTRFSIGEPGMSVSARCLDFSEAMRAGGLKCPVEPDLRNDIWIKLLGNIAFNPLSALSRATMAQICRHQDTRALVATMMHEALAVAEKLGCRPGISVERRLAGAERVGEHKTSTLQDLERGRPMELDVLLAAVVELAALTRTPVPKLCAIHAVTDLLAQTTFGSSAA
ncbi:MULTISPECIES: 2-dehydropantoate 2-reductase [unclassified Streptomyces]|uniref:2-dehydropantoate 2-reductase n=1 Tax=unclassified Streptomyces TaxID=2593676 RepID=UPI002DD811E7|nr:MULTISPECIES: 2-dehydropantoate 2-reductase [unclassified Streptomyces]WSA96338.1 2-dehydropantoate 2-reductase [Streptomyces sp. NBC_01795]WSB80752.1 2-dehydropantoate 2-reductase [Streptomyces sp. NBC_01775]WSS11039.1 2-dehydropantoate 2-reductase [Streptomyces sp. NBC_01186]WSS39747.1 2-dehydropantoate 2-reductase [Streptomyces sp. NBC_01187]